MHIAITAAITALGIGAAYYLQGKETGQANTEHEIVTVTEPGMSDTTKYLLAIAAGIALAKVTK